MLDLKIKLLHENAKAPSRANPDDAGLDLWAVNREWDRNLACWVYDFGLAMEIPPGHVGLIFPRSSICKTPLTLTNSVGVIDAGYRGPVKAFFREHLQSGLLEEALPKAGDRIAQLIVLPFPAVRVTVTSELSETQRGDKGWGSSGRT